MRVPTLTLYGDLKNNVNFTRDKFADKQLQLSTGQRFLHRSEEPATASEIAKIEQQMRDTDQYLKNVETATQWAKVTNGKNQEVIDIMAKITEELSSANNATHPPQYRVDIGSTVNNLLEQLVQISESRIGDTYLFSGTNTSQPPFTVTRDANGMITSVAYNGDANTEKRETQFDDNTVVSYGELGGGTDGLFEATANNIDLMNHLVTVRDELSAGRIPATADMQLVDDDLEHVIGKLTANGVQQQWFENQEMSLQKIQASQTDLLGDKKGLDMARGMIELTELQTSLEASLQMIGQTSRMSVLNYI